MKIILVFLIFAYSHIYSQQLQSIRLDGNQISTLYYTSGIFNQNLGGSNSAAFEWPKGTGKTAIFTSGLSIGGYVNDSLREAMASYKGEYVPGYSNNGIFYTDSRFKFYKVKRGDNYINNPDWLNWGLMVQFGAPYYDANNNGTYDYFVDIPGYKGASQTIFICLTDGDPNRHMVTEGFGGGTRPLFAEVHFTAWCYDEPAYEDMQFLNWEIVNKGNYAWDSLYLAVYNDFDLGNSDDDYIGCDTVRKLSYCYNGDNEDSGPTWAYGINPPAVGIAYLDCNNPFTKMVASTYVTNTSTPGPACEKDANGEAWPAYNFMRGLKKDMTPWVIPTINPPQTTKYCYSGDPETNTGWNERQGCIQNCGGSLTGTYVPINSIGNRRSVCSFSNYERRLNVKDTFNIRAVQLIAQGDNHLNSVTRLKQATDKAHELCQNGFVIGINPVSTEIPRTFNLYQNYPNPFNPVTKIKFDIPKAGNVILKIYDAVGREITSLLNEKLNAGMYSIDWEAAIHPSGIYFYQINSGTYTETKKMILIK